MHRIISQDRQNRVLFLVWAVLVFLGLGLEFWKYILDGQCSDLVYFLGLGYEGNLPTWYSSALLLLCSLQLAVIATTKTERRAPFAKHWWGLAAMFLYISMDETAQVHENTGRWFDFNGLLFYGWVIPASAVVLVIGVCYLKFLWRLPRRTRTQFILSGAIYVGGALGLDYLLGYWVDRTGTEDLTYCLIDLVQESLEIFGVTLFLCSLTEYLRTGRSLAPDTSGGRAPTAGERERAELAAAVTLFEDTTDKTGAASTEPAEVCGA